MSTSKVFVHVDGDEPLTLVALDEIARVTGNRGSGARVTVQLRDGSTHKTTWPLRAKEFRLQNDGTLRTNEAAERARRDRKERQLPAQSPKSHVMRAVLKDGA